MKLSVKGLFNLFISSLRERIGTTIPIKYHVLFWLGYFTFNLIRWGSFHNDFTYSLQTNLVEFPIHIVVIYFNVYYLIPTLFLKKKYLQYVGAIFLILVLVYIVRTSLIYTFTGVLSPELGRPVSFLDFNHFIVVALGELYVITFVTAIKVLVDYSIEKKRNEELSQLQLSTELKFLRTQVQPHFFFNTLNNLYALALNKSDNMPRLLLKLSDLMEYVLYEVQDSKASLLKEIDHINNYIDIENLRFKDRVETEMHITGDIEDVKVPPLLLITFVENCFKHGLKNNEKMKMEMSFEVINGRYLNFNISNNFNPNTVDEVKKGIGISNSLRRLKILFSKDFELKTSADKGVYNLFLKIPVS
ncbi:sensor histidine kinase [Aestuariivivens sediminicola]|uniref:sensor histidine kinase n=1 Tax=Aestuariivivens sediminicola TaxID=2913560 RepID=UPI001F580D9E|nr:histidine kinase [Aestuariivivens sediminicola]